MRRDAAWGASTGSQGLALTTSMRIRNLKKEEIQERRAPTVVGEGLTT